jgi:hypothetical protein
MVEEMWNRLGHTVRRCSLTSVLLASLAVLPLSAGAARDEEKSDRSTDKHQTQAQQAGHGPKKTAQPPALGRATGPQRQPSGPVAAPAAAAPAVRTSTGRTAAPIPSRSREASGRGQSSAPRFDPRPNSRQPEPRVAAPPAEPADRRVTAPAAPRSSRLDSPALQKTQPHRRPVPASRESYQVYRAPNQANAEPERAVRASPVAPARASGPPERQPAVVRSPRGPSGASVQKPTPASRPQGEQRPAVSRGTAADPTRPEAKGRRLAVPEASFRGPGSESKVRVVAPEAAKLAPARLQNWVREQSRQRGRLDRARPTVDVVGNPVPRDAVLLNRNTFTNITINYTNIVNNFGSPGFPYVVAPGAVWGGGYFPRTHRQHPTVVINLFYPFYYSDPQFVGFFYSGYYPSVYAYFGWSPGWIYPQRVYCAPADYVYASATPYRYYSNGHRLDYTGATRAISDLRSSWLDGDIGPLAAHLTNEIDIRVYFSGEYSYTTTTDDFYAMTLDALATTRTLAMDFNDPIWISGEEVFYTGRQVFDDPDGERHTVYVSFRFRRLGAEWYLVALGTSRSPIEHDYTDFRI